MSADNEKYVAPVPPRIPSHTEQFEKDGSHLLDWWVSSTNPREDNFLEFKSTPVANGNDDVPNDKPVRS